MSLHVNYLISCCSSHPKQKCLCVWNKTIGCLCVRITRQSTSTPPFCSAQATMNRVDVSRAPTPETMKKNLFFLNSSYTYIHSQTSFLGEAYKWTEGTPLPPPQPQNLWKRRGEETWANNVRWNGGPNLLYEKKKTSACAIPLSVKTQPAFPNNNRRWQGGL